MLRHGTGADGYPRFCALCRHRCGVRMLGCQSRARVVPPMGRRARADPSRMEQKENARQVPDEKVPFVSHPGRGPLIYVAILPTGLIPAGLAIATVMPAAMAVFSLNGHRNRRFSPSGISRSRTISSGRSMWSSWACVCPASKGPRRSPGPAC